MLTKTKIREEEIEGKMEDRVSRLPHDLQIRILSSLDDTKHAVQTSMLLKRWDSLWRWIPVLDFNCFSFHNVNSEKISMLTPLWRFENVNVFDKFVDRVLRFRDQSAKLDRLTFTRPGYSIGKILENVFGYAFSHGVNELEAKITDSYNGSWPVCLDASFECVTSLKLQSEFRTSCSFLGPRSGLFQNLTILYLSGASITDLDPFSGFPVLESLTLDCCFIDTDGETLSVQARNLSELSISGYRIFKCCELTTPRLRSFHFEGPKPPLFRIHEGLPLLDTMVISIDTHGYRHTIQKITFNNLLTLFCITENVKYLTLHWFTVEILSSFPEELVKQSLPFRNLKCLKLDFNYESYKGSSISTKIVADVKAYLLQNSPDVEVIMINQAIQKVDYHTYLTRRPPRVHDAGAYFDSFNSWESLGGSWIEPTTYLLPIQVAPIPYQRSYTQESWGGSWIEPIQVVLMPYQLSYTHESWEGLWIEPTTYLLPVQVAPMPYLLSYMPQSVITINHPFFNEFSFL